METKIEVLFEEVFKILPQAWPPQDEDEDEDVGQQGSGHCSVSSTPRKTTSVQDVFNNSSFKHIRTTSMRNADSCSLPVTLHNLHGTKSWSLDHLDTARRAARFFNARRAWKVKPSSKRFVLPAMAGIVRRSPEGACAVQSVLHQFGRLLEPGARCVSVPTDDGFSAGDGSNQPAQVVLYRQKIFEARPPRLGTQVLTETPKFDCTEVEGKSSWCFSSAPGQALSVC
ncbi:unnamed protein product [Symbiodinium necroappetens]|uniref:Uncharacterized protein n=1 Tax=Symbiodinium necroappetens TaxID=1628268 RepID=A0A812J014_9DINO|nr:unnamed protein product [Symbiodinium necroappetens]